MSKLNHEEFAELLTNHLHECEWFWTEEDNVVIFTLMQEHIAQFLKHYSVREVYKELL
jgi:hypothetical protein